MNACCQGRFCKGSVANPKNLAANIAMVFNAPLSFGLLAVRGTGKVGARLANKRRTLFSFCFLRSNFTKPSLANFFSGLISTNKTAPSAFNCVKPSVVSLRHALKILNSVVCFISVNVVDMFFGVKQFQPTSCYNTVHKSFTAKSQVPLRVFGWSIVKMLSENFSALRNGVNVVKESVFDSVYVNANHGVLS